MPDNRLSASEARQELVAIAEQVLEVQHWWPDYGVCRCPLGHSARVYIDRGTPILHCFKESCHEAVVTLNGEMADQCGELGGGPLQDKKGRDTRREHLNRLRSRGKARLLPRLLKAPVPLESWPEQSPVPIPDNIEEHWPLFLCALYPPDDGLIWTGGFYDTGRPEFGVNFQTRTRWLELPGPFGEQIGTVLFDEVAKERGQRKRVYSGSRLYWIVESDRLDCGAQGAVIQHTRRYLKLRAVVDTGGKSLHSYFEPWPWWKGPEHYQRGLELLAILEGLTADRQMLRSSITARLPGIRRESTERWQRLLYLDPKKEPEPKTRQGPAPVHSTYENR